MRVGNKTTHNIRMPFRAGITHDMRVKYGDRSFDIKGIVNPEERNIYLDLVCEEIF
jgi:SPP1 family predicted phage head-tail adaptor